MPSPISTDIRAVIFDVHGTLLLGGGPMRHDPAADLRIHELLHQRGQHLEESPTRALEQSVKRHHLASSHDYPEIDLRQLWAALLGAEEVGTEWLAELEHARQPLILMPCARETLAALSSRNLVLGLLSNAQADTLPALCRELGENPFTADLCLLSYEHGIAKPSPLLFKLLVERLSARGIPPHAAVMVGNDPLHDIAPARAIGMKTVLLANETALPAYQADAVITDLFQLLEILA